MYAPGEWRVRAKEDLIEPLLNSCSYDCRDEGDGHHVLFHEQVRSYTWLCLGLGEGQKEQPALDEEGAAGRYCYRVQLGEEGATRLASAVKGPRGHTTAAT